MANRKFANVWGKVVGTGVAVEAEWDNFGNFHLPMAKLSGTLNKWLQPSDARTQRDGSTPVREKTRVGKM